MSCVQTQVESLGLSSSAVNVIMASWRKGTKVPYQTYLSKWIKWCTDKCCNPLTSPISTAIDFLAHLYDQGYSYSSINTARSALSSLLQTDPPFGQQALVKRFMKGIFELKPSAARYSDIWDINPVFNFIHRKPDLSSMTLKELTHQPTFLLLILSGQRCQTIHMLSIENMTLSETRCMFHINNHVKQSRPGTHLDPIIFNSYPTERKLCVVHHVKEYLNRTTKLRPKECKQLLISLQKPHGAVSKDTISRWCKQFLNSAGVDTGKFKSHSTRAASTSHLVANNVEISAILKSVGWSTERTFQTFYHKQLEKPVFNFGSALLESVN